MNATLNYSGTLIVVTCWCGMKHGVPEELREHQRRQFDNNERPVHLYCPLGHAHVPAGKPKIEYVRERLDWEQNARARANARADQAEASARAYKGVATKARKRAAAALCPCCGRSFVQIRRHMAAKHPDYLAEHGITPDPRPVA